ncbi:MAG TPA: electron transfer flavoprotein subunit alpha/FixB family protein [Candidatus Thermoplasmatota archaeon]|nr:electron transfer flavoprotein subunit alpha/FixB family protein [Candidatus Thermoplasmatota archaeon]
MSKGTYRDMWVYAERRGQGLSPVALEMVSEARRLMDKYNRDYASDEKVVAVVVGHKVDAAARDAVEHGADIVVQLDAPEFEHFMLEPYTRAVADASRAKGPGQPYDKPRYFLFPATHNGRDLSATYCAEVETGCASDCNLLYIEDAPIKHRFKTGGVEKKFERVLHMKRPDFSGFEWSTILCLDNPEKDFHPQTCSVIPGSFKPRREPARRGDIRRSAPRLPAEATRLTVRSRRPVKKLDLTRSEVVVAIGRGIGDNPTLGFQHGLALARELDAELGLSRGVVTASYTVDPSVAQYLNEERQIGETGQIVKPKVYVALGISGAIQHKKGMDQSAFIVTVNKDPDTAIREFSDVYIVGDLFDVVPKLNAALAKLKGGH